MEIGLIVLLIGLMVLQNKNLIKYITLISGEFTMKHIVSVRFMIVMIGCLLLCACEDDNNIGVVAQLRLEKRNKQSQFNQLAQEIETKQQQINSLPEQFKNEKQQKIAELEEQLSKLRAKSAESIISITKEQLQEDYKIFEDKVSLFISDELSKVSAQQAEELLTEGEQLQCRLSLKVKQLNSEIDTLVGKINELKKQLNEITEDVRLKERINAHIEKLGEEKKAEETSSKDVAFSLTNIADLLNKLEKYKQTLMIVEQ